MRFIPQFEPLIKNEDVQSVSEQMKTGWVGPSNTTIEFERKLQQITNTRFASATTSGTAALILAISSLRIPKEKKILFPSYTFLAGANAARFLGYEVELIDINLSTCCMNVALLEKRLDQLTEDIDGSNDVGCVIFVNHNGYVGKDLQKAKDLCVEHGIPLIEDAAQCMGIDGAFKTGDVSIASFSVPKLITTGQGGAVFTDSDWLNSRIKQLRDHGDNWKQTKIHDHLGINLKFNDIQAAYGLSQLNRLDSIKQRKKEILDEYSKHINIIRHNQDLVWMVTYLTLDSQELVEELQKFKIQAQLYYRPINENPPYKSDEHFPSANIISDFMVYLPSSLNLTNEEIEYICEIVKKYPNLIIG